MPNSLPASALRSDVVATLNSAVRRRLVRSTPQDFASTLQTAGGQSPATSTPLASATGLPGGRSPLAGAPAPLAAGSASLVGLRPGQPPATRSARNSSPPPPLAGVGAGGRGPALSAENRRMVEDAARRAGIDPALLAAVAQAESGFNPRAQSRAGAKGVMQLMDATAARLGVKDPFDPAQSLDGGARFLASLLKQFGGDLRKAVAAYNAGPGAVQKYGGVPPYQETQRYVPKVLGLFTQFRQTWADRPTDSEAT